MRPPQNRIDADPIYILSDDPAWDSDRINTELEGLEDSGQHPWIRYLKGEGRFDLYQTIDGHSPAEYLKPDVEPTKFMLRRMGPTNFARVQDMLTRELHRDEGTSFASVWLEAARCGIVSAEGPKAPKLDASNGRLSEASLQAIMDQCGGLPSVTALGTAAWIVSQPLTDAEKKR